MPERRTAQRRIEEGLGRLARGLMPRTPDFGVLLADQTAVAVEVWEALVDYCASADPRLAERVSALEKKGDVLRDRNQRTLRKAFSAGFDRDLTASAIQRIDDLANYGKTTVREMEILALEPDDHTLAIAREIRDGARDLHAATLALPEGPKAVERRTVAVHKHERNIEKLYRRAVAELFPTDPDAIMGEGDELRNAVGHLLAAMRRREVYRHLSNAADRLDAAGRIVRKIAVATV
jgi:uncharacterized protein Yka (UPF0111/DUF47 family)